MFNTVLNELTRGLDDDDDGDQDLVDRSYWEARASRDSLAMADRLLDVLREWEPALELKYNKWHIGVAKDGIGSA